MPISLDPRQREAADHVCGPMLVIAGAGTGKTTVLVERIARLIETGAAKPSEILAITYTDNSTDELRDRVARRLRSKAGNKVEVRNFHTYSWQLLQRLGEKINVLEDPDLWIFLRRRIADLPLKNFIRAANIGEFLNDFIQFFERCHDDLVTPERYEEYVARVERGELPLPRVHPTPKEKETQSAPTRDEVLARCHEIAAVFRKVEAMLREENLWTFSHMIVRAVRALETDEALLCRERERARFLLLDEFQDVNYAQIRLARLLAGEEANVFAVGDPDQAIYYFRGASSAAFTQFIRFYPHTKVVRLNRNHRSLPPILTAAHALIEKNPAVETGNDAGRRAPLVSARAENEQLALSSLWGAPPVDLVGFTSRLFEAADVARRIDELHRDRHADYSDFAVLYRNHAHREDLVAELSVRGVPFTVVGIDVLDTPEVRDLLAALRVVNSPSDAVSLFRLAALPEWQLPPGELHPELEAVREPELPRILEKFAGGKRLLERLHTIRAEVRAPNMPMAAVAERVQRAFNFPRSSPELLAFREFVAKWEGKALTKSKALSEFLSYLDLFLQAGGSVPLPVNDSEDAVRLMTAHAAKGLEFRHVFILRASSQSFPAPYQEPLFEFPAALRAPDSAETAGGKDLHREEERRLFYVAMTRACDALAIYGKLQGTKPTPAGYIRELFGDPLARGAWSMRTAAELRLDLEAHAEQVSPLASWLLSPVDLALEDVMLSSSAIGEYQQCPLRYKIHREWRLPTDSSPAMQFGNAMHTALKLFGESSEENREALRAQVLAAFCKTVQDAYIEDPVQRRLYEEQGIRQLTAFVAIHAAARPNVEAVERGFVAEIGGVKVKGRVDRLDRLPSGGIAIVDYKTGSPRTQEDADGNLQLSLYALGAQRAWGVTPERLVFYNLETNSEVATTRTSTQLADAEREVEAVAAGIAQGIFEPKTGRHCARCAYNAICPTQERSLVHIESSVTAAGKVN